MRDHLTSRPGCGEVNGLNWHPYNEAYGVGAEHSRFFGPRRSPDSEFCHPAATACDHAVDPRTRRHRPRVLPSVAVGRSERRAKEENRVKNRVSTTKRG